jgi:glycosyltransferase involved in cell wall biosynthesis
VRVDQWVPALHRGDAIGDSARLMRDAFRRWGHTADVYALELDEDLQGDGRPWSDWRAGGPDDVVILHYALPSPLSAALQSHAGRRVLLHHNITPAHFFVHYDPEMVHICTLGRAELAGLAGHVDLALGDSEFNRRELAEAGFTRTGVLPIYLDFERYRERPNAVLRRLLDDGRTNVLFVGRIAPNKRQDDLVRMASYWKRFIGPDVRLLLVGKLPRRRHYFDALQSLFYEEHFTPWEVLLPGHVSHDDLLAYYASAHVFVSASDHEGFGVPLVESMLMDVPVVAYRTTAVGDTLGDAGIQFGEKRLDLMAEAAQAVAREGPLRAGVLARQRERVRDFAPAAVEGILRAHLESL